MLEYKWDIMHASTQKHYTSIEPSAKENLSTTRTTILAACYFRSRRNSDPALRNGFACCLRLSHEKRQKVKSKERAGGGDSGVINGATSSFTRAAIGGGSGGGGGVGSSVLATATGAAPTSSKSGENQESRA